MSGRKVLVLLVVVAALAAFIGLYERNLPSSEEREASARRVLGIDAEAVRSVTIRSAASTVRLDRGDDTAWRLLEPVIAPADGEVVEQMLAALTSLEKERTLTGMDSSGLGLDPPRLSVEVRIEEGGRKLDLGSAVPGSASLVAVLGDDPNIYVVADSILTELDRAPDEWRDRALFPGDSDSLDRLVLTIGGERRSLLRRGGGFWLEEPVADRADADKVTDLLHDLEAIRVGTFIAPEELGEMGAEDAMETGLADPGWILEAYAADDETPFRLEVGAPVGDSTSRRYGRVGELTFEADSELFAAMARPVAEWLSPRWTTLRPYEVDRLTFSGEGASVTARAGVTAREGATGRAGGLELTRAGGDWLRDGERIEAGAVNDLLYAVTGAGADEVVAAADAAGLSARMGEPRWTLILASDDGTEEVLTAYPPLPDGRAPARVSARDSVLLLPLAEVAEVDRLLAAVASAEPLPEPADGVSADGG